ncbi:MAG TPA: hypothetical protein VNM91_07985 [Dehalococcoidia bacterium]|nr:hypothetical protein [Dehalococcoidia bacterium]
MPQILARPRRAVAASMLAAAAVLAAGCGSIPFLVRPANGYEYGAGAPLRVAIIDETGGAGWTPAIEEGVRQYAAATPYLLFQRTPEGAHIVLTFRRYVDSQPPPLPGYVFPAGAGGFAAVYDVNGAACNYPPSPLPLNCTGEIAYANIYLNDAIPPGADIERRRLRLVLHEMGHGFGLTRHAPDLDITNLSARYGWE